MPSSVLFAALSISSRKLLSDEYKPAIFSPKATMQAPDRATYTNSIHKSLGDGRIIVGMRACESGEVDNGVDLELLCVY